jgi:tetratricopeptide (TPR) repeat protein
VIEPSPLWDFDDPTASAERFLDAGEGADEPDRTAWLTQYARALGLQERYAEATKVLDRLTSDAPQAATYVALERGRVLRSAGDDDAARPLFEEAARIAAAAGLDALQVDALHMSALVASAERQLAINEEALALARGSADRTARDWDASLLNNIGMTHADAGDFEAALASFEEALAARERIGDAGRTRVARWMVGWALRNLGRREEALVVQRALKEELVSVGEVDPYVDDELALLQE